jgi:predicted RNase H-like nuclease (RuvC/YqgF family)
MALSGSDSDSEWVNVSLDETETNRNVPLRDEIEELKAQLRVAQEKEKEIAQLREELHAQRNVIANRDNRIRTLESENRRQRAIMAMLQQQLTLAQQSVVISGRALARKQKKNKNNPKDHGSLIPMNDVRKMRSAGAKQARRQQKPKSARQSRRM